jgi:hypothetical protein
LRVVDQQFRVLAPDDQLGPDGVAPAGERPARHDDVGAARSACEHRHRVVRCRHVRRQPDAPDLDDVAVVQPLGPVDRNAVHGGPVRRPEVLDLHATLERANDRVVA